MTAMGMATTLVIAVTASVRGLERPSGFEPQGCNFRRYCCFCSERELRQSERELRLSNIQILGMISIGF